MFWFTARKKARELDAEMQEYLRKQNREYQVSLMRNKMHIIKQSARRILLRNEPLECHDFQLDKFMYELVLMGICTKDELP